METLGLWAAPFLLIPAKGLLAISAAAQYSQELAAFTAASASQREPSQRLTFLRRALMCLYLGVVADALGALLGSLSMLLPGAAVHLMVIATCVGVCFLLAASLLLVMQLGKNLLVPHSDSLRT